MIECTLVLIKPDGIKRGLIGELIKRFEQRGLKIVGMKMVWMTKELSQKHYAAHVKKPFYKAVEAFMTSSPVVAMVIEGVHAVEYVRKVTGATEPKSADVGTIRGDFAHLSYEHADKRGITLMNLVHASGTKEEAQAEIKLWFKEAELFDYETGHDPYVR